MPTVTRVADHALRVEWDDCVDLIAFGPAQTDEATADGINFIRTSVEE